MAKDYGRNRPQRRGNNGSRQFLLVLLAFLIGYLTASVFDFVSLSHWINTKLMAQQTDSVPANRLAAKKTDLPKPKFEFYTLLANGKTPNSPQKTAEKTVAPVEIKTAAIPAPTSGSQPVFLAENKNNTITNLPESYSIQVGSFKTSPEAERMRASLILKGFSVNIVPIAQGSVTWYRVVIGPYKSHDDAQKVQVAFAQTERVRGMIRKNG